MDQPSRSRVDRDGSLQVLWEDGDRIFCRGAQHPDGGVAAVLAVLPTAEHPTPAALDRLAHEFALKDELDGAWAVRPLALERDRGRTMLVLEDRGGEPLGLLLDAPIEVGGFLRLAIGIVTSLGKAHQCGLVHKDLKPANILVNRANNEVRLTGFGIASRLPRERQPPEPPEFIAGTLAYMAPEQTGRMNRSIDTRSDLYALGVTFYQMLTGSLPFTAADPMEWVHCHIARKPVPPCERLETVPAPVSAITMKLLAKTAEERYQTTGGVESDLRRCLAEWEVRGCIDDFPLGERDTPDRLLIPEKLYGRAREVETLLACFDRIVKGGAPELVLVSGYSGVGKSSVVHELHKVLEAPRGLFAAGKFDQYKRDIPYATLAQAFQNLVRSLLGRSDAELSCWRDALLEALGPNGRLMVEVVPELKLVVGEQTPVADLPPQDAQRRFQLAFRRFIGAFARPEHPLALFLDDLQWLDAATLDLLEDLLTQPEVRHLMLIGAYRDNEVGAAHPLMRKLEAIKTAGGKVAEIALAPLAREDLGQLIADAVRCEPERAAPLAQLVLDKTGGNPFFAIQFMSSLAQEGMLAFGHDAARWSWDLGRIHAKRYTDNVVDLMVGKFIHLPAETQNALRLLSCLGNIADFTTLSNVLGTSEGQVHAALWPSVRQELVERLPGAYRFAHDRIQEAAYSLVPEEQRGEAHLRIGRLLAAQAPAENRGEAIFDIVNQFNRGAALITSRDERERLAEFNLLAGKRAKASTAYASALTYLIAGRALLPEDARELRPELAFALELSRAECELLTGALTTAEARLANLACHAATTLPDLAAVTGLRVELFASLERRDRAVEVGLDYLRRVGIAWSAHPTQEDIRQEFDRMWRQMEGRPIEALLDLPLMTDRVACGTMDVLSAVVTAAWHTDDNLRCLAVGRMANLSLNHGNCDASCLAYAVLGTVLGSRFGDYKAAYRFGHLGLDLLERPGMGRFKARASLIFRNHVMPCMQPIRTCLSFARHALETAQRAGDINYATYSRHHLVTHLLASGDPLAEVQREAEAGLEYARQARVGLAIDRITGQLQLIRTLRGLTPVFGCLDDAGFDEQRFERHLQEDPRLTHAACWYWIRKLQARVLADDHPGAIVAAAAADCLLWTSSAIFERAEFHFYGALARAALCDAASVPERTEHLEALAVHHRQLQVWAENCPENFENRAALVGAEIARLDRRQLDAMRLYEQAIHSARANGFVHNEAIACEVAARFYAALGFQINSQAHLRNARHCYLSWGADGKVRQLDQLHPQLREEERAPAPAGTIGVPVEHLDLATMITVSQAVSGEIVLDKLLETLMRTAIEQAGAERGLLIVPRGIEQRIAAEAATGNDGVVVQLRDEPLTAAALPESVLHYVARTNESVVLDDAVAQSAFATDPYIRERQARSILCLPLISQAKLIGVLYLENNLAHRVFAPARTAVLKLLASQAAIAIENTRLYRDLAEREAKIRRLVDANIIGIFIWDFDGQILEANDAFLRTVGYDREDLVSGRMRWMDMTPSDWRERDAEWIREHRRTGLRRPIEKEYFRKDGSRVPVLMGAATFDEIGNQGVAYVLDLTERKRAEEALRMSEERFRTLVQFSFDVYWEADAQHRFVRQQFAEGLADAPAPGSEIGKTRWEVPYLEPDEEAWRKHRKTLDAHLPFRDFELARPLSDGGKRYVSVSGLPVFNETGQFVGYRGVGRHITERKRAEEALRKMQMELAHANRVATLGQLTASIAHEVNQPIAATLTNAEAALRWLGAERSDLDEVRQALGRIVRDANRAGTVVHRIRNFSKKTPSRVERVEINAAIREVIELTRSETTKSGVAVRTELAEGLPPIDGDRIELQQVILNLILNAIEAMGEMRDGSRDLLIGTGRTESGDVLVAVRDSGPGLAPAALEHLFDAFHTTKPNGLGLGLSICRSIVEAHGGRLWAGANVPRGACFQFTLPARPDIAA